MVEYSKEGIRFAFLPLWLRFILRDMIIYTNRINQLFANLIIWPIKLFEARKLKSEIKEKRIRKVLIIRNDRIGDAVLSIKIINKLKEHFKDLYVLVSSQNFQILKEELNSEIKLIKETEIREHEPFDLVIDFNGSMANNKIKSRYKIGFNRGIFSIFYSNFYPKNLTESKLQYIEAMMKMIKYCLDLDLKIDDLPPKDFKKKKMNQIFIFVGNKPNRNLPYEKWKELILLSAKKAKTIVADDPDQRIMNQLKKDKEIIQNKNIQLIVGPRELKDLAKIANDSKLFIGLDGGAEHYLEKHTNSLTIYTCGFPVNWKPFSLNAYVSIATDSSQILEETTTSAGIKKYVLYNLEKRKPCYDLICDHEEFKDIKFESIIKANLFF
ncbi:MAG: hypothetical protein QXJ06_05380 [Candidatus Aenigmatarchaeota archaeon]